MSTKTRKILIISIISVLVTMGFLGYFFSEIRAQGQLLEEQINILTDNNSKQATNARVKREVLETSSEREQLASSFFKDEGDSIVFLTEIEELAKNSGLKLRTETLDKVPASDTVLESIKVVFVYDGPKSLVFNFSELMESLPYHSRVESLNLRQIVDNNWEGRLTVFVTIKSS